MCHSVVCGPSEVIADNSMVDLDCEGYMIVPGFKTLQTVKNRLHFLFQDQSVLISSHIFLSFVSHCTKLKKGKHVCNNQNKLVQKYLLEY